MRKRIIAALLLPVFVVMIAIPVQAYGETGHNKLIEQILFGSDSGSDKMKEKQQEKLTCLEYATMICLDQYNNYYSDELKLLNDKGIPNIISDISEINFKGNQYHRKYSHRGWDFQYGPTATDKGSWAKRKTLLTETVKYVFEFEENNDWWRWKWLFPQKPITKEQCDSFAALLYYLHILGEYEEVTGQITDQNNTRSNFTALTISVIPLAVAHPYEGNEDVFWELEKHLPIIFESQKEAGSNVYQGMMSDIKMIATKARNLASEQGGINPENFAEYCQCSLELIEVLKKRVPGLLKNEPFFSEVFY